MPCKIRTTPFSLNHKIIDLDLIYYQAEEPSPPRLAIGEELIDQAIVG